MIKKIKDQHSFRETKDFALEKRRSEFDVDNSVAQEFEKKTGVNERCYLRLEDGSQTAFNSKEELETLLASKLDINAVVIEDVRLDGARRKVYQISGDESKLLPFSKEKNERLETKSIKLEIEKKINRISKEALIFSIPEDIPVNVEEERHSLVYNREKIVRKTREIESKFFKVKDNAALFKIGRSFADDVKFGKKSFGFISPKNDKESQVNTVFGVSSFFNFEESVKVCVITSELNLKDMSKRLLDNKKITPIEIYESEFQGVETDGTIFITIESIFDHGDLVPEILERIHSFSAITLISFPSVTKLSEKMNDYYHLFRFIDNMSLVVNPKETSSEIMKDHVEYLKSYNVVIKGALLEGDSQRNKSKRKN